MATITRREGSGTGKSGQQWAVDLVENDANTPPAFRVTSVIVTNPGHDTISLVATSQGQSTGTLSTTQDRTFNVPGSQTVIDDRWNADGTRNFGASFSCTVWSS